MKKYYIFLLTCLVPAITCSCQVSVDWNKISYKPFVVEVPYSALFNDTFLSANGIKMLKGLDKILRDSSSFCIEISRYRTPMHQDNIKRLRQVIVIRNYLCPGIEYRRVLVRLTKYNKYLVDENVRFALIRKN